MLQMWICSTELTKLCVAEVSRLGWESETCFSLICLFSFFVSVIRFGYLLLSFRSKSDRRDVMPGLINM
jgi:hypothetical protein